MAHTDCGEAPDKGASLHLADQLDRVGGRWRHVPASRRARVRVLPTAPVQAEEAKRRRCSSGQGVSLENADSAVDARADRCSGTPSRVIAPASSSLLSFVLSESRTPSLLLLTLKNADARLRPLRPPRTNTCG
jgi:hypothetical protein